MTTEKIIAEYTGELGKVTVTEHNSPNALTRYIVNHSYKPYLSERYIDKSEALQYAQFLACKY